MKVALICAETVRLRDTAGLAKMLGLSEETDFFKKDIAYGYHGCPLDDLVNAANTHNPDILIAPEFFFYDGTPYTETEKNNALKCIQGMVIKKDMLILPGTIVWQKDGLMRNSCPIIAEGEVKAEYFKATDGGDSDVALKHGCIYLPGKENGRVINWKGKEIGIEICADHEGKKLKSRKKPLDMHIVIAAGKTLHPDSIAAKNKGYGILCDGNGLCDAAINDNGILAYMHGRLEGNVKLYEIGRA
ncbi:MAG: hypothetical protein WC852_01630 [Candidatus Nanoarchaeia archaeon]|jgi:hypothetical protein